MADQPHPQSPHGDDPDAVPYAYGIYDGDNRPPTPSHDVVGEAHGALEMTDRNRPATLTLHPDLARIAVRYQRIRSQRIQNRITDAQAATALAELVARDDYGVMWTINASDGGWMYLGKDKVWHPGEPPKYGIATATAHALDRAAGGELRFDNPDMAINWTDADRSNDDAWDGAIERRPQPVHYERPRWLYPLLAVLAIGGGVFWWLTNRAGDDTPDDAPAVTVELPGEL